MTPVLLIHQNQNKVSRIKLFSSHKLAEQFLLPFLLLELLNHNRIGAGFIKNIFRKIGLNGISSK